jgi:CO/xanthine dehydrogenase Mo-binding subunit
MKTACDASGRLIAQQVDAIADGGAHASLSLGVIETAMEHACGPYRFAKHRRARAARRHQQQHMRCVSWLSAAMR